jgi:hypothetical protein
MLANILRTVARVTRHRLHTPVRGTERDGFVGFCWIVGRCVRLSDSLELWQDQETSVGVFGRWREDLDSRRCCGLLRLVGARWQSCTLSFLVRGQRFVAVRLPHISPTANIARRGAH